MTNFRLLLICSVLTFNFAQVAAADSNLDAHEKICAGLMNEFNVPVQDLQALKNAEAQDRPYNKTILSGTNDLGETCEVEILALSNDLSGWASNTCVVSILEDRVEYGIRHRNDRVAYHSISLVRDSSLNMDNAIKASKPVSIKALQSDSAGRLTAFTTVMKSGSPFDIPIFPGYYFGTEADKETRKFEFVSLENEYVFRGNVTYSLTPKNNRARTCTIKKVL